MKILGIAYTAHDQSICLVENGEIKYHFQLERFNRRKHNWIGSKNKDRNKLAREFEDFALKFVNKENPDMIATSGIALGRVKKGKVVPKKYPLKKISNNKIDNLLDYSLYDNVYYVDHHIAHAAYAYLTSSFDGCDILAYDGGGERFQTIFIDKYHNIKDLGLNGSNEIILGSMWGDAAKYSMDKFAAGKLMGLSAYGAITKSHLHLLSNFQTKKFKEEIDWGDFNEVKNLSAALQYYSIINVLNTLNRHKTSNNICISGGVGLNGYINQYIQESGLYKNVYIPPATADDGISIGAALHALWILEGKKPKNKNLAYLGNEYKIPNIGIEYSYENLYHYIAQKISEGKVVSWYQGRSESGPRALGNRSILADPRDPNMKDHINQSVKHREWFRPFAPAILKEHITEWFENIEDARYMLKIAKFREGMGKKVPSVCHEDYTGRVQTVAKEDNQHFYNLIKAFYDITEIPILLNTSFNDNTEPIVETPEDALQTFKKNNIDILVLENKIILK